MNTGSILMGRPSLGSWISYGLGTENDSLPAFVVLPDPGGGIKGGPPAWGNGYLPATFQGTTFRTGATPIVDLRPQPMVSAIEQQGTLDFLRVSIGVTTSSGTPIARSKRASNPTSWPTACSRRRRPSWNWTVKLPRLWLSTALVKKRPTSSAVVVCSLAGMIERGVRFVQLYSGDTNGWDAHNDVAQNHGQYCRKTDKPIAGLLTRSAPPRPVG